MRGQQRPDIDTVLLRVRASTKGDKPRFGTVFHGIKNVVIVKSGFKLDLISGRISRIFAKHIKNIGPCIANEVAIVVKIRVFFHAEHNSADAIHVQLHTNSPFNTISPSGHRPGGLFVFS